jgi:hypothetical protein
MNVASPVLPLATTSRTKISEVVLSNGLPGYTDVCAIVDRGGLVTCRLRLSWRERWAVLTGGNIWLQVRTGRMGLQPFKLHVSEPPIEECL